MKTTEEQRECSGRGSQSASEAKDYRGSFPSWPVLWAMRVREVLATIDHKLFVVVVASGTQHPVS